MSKFIRTFLIGIAPIAILGMGAEVRAQDEVDCFHCVDTRDIASAAVTAGKIRKKAVTTIKLAPKSVTTAKIANGAVTVNKVSPKLSNAIGTSCPAGESVVGMNANGRFICESKLVQSFNPDLTGKTYCLNGQSNWLQAVAGVSAEVTAFPFAARLDFTSPTELTIAYMYQRVMQLFIPSLTLVDDGDDSGDPVMGTYTVVGNQLTISEPIHDSGGEIKTTSYTMTPDGQVFVGSFFKLYDGEDFWATAIMAGVRAASCD